MVQNHDRLSTANQIGRTEAAWRVVRQVSPRARLDNDHFDPQRRTESSVVGLACQLEGIVRTAQGALAVCHDRQVVRRPSHPPERPELAERHVISTGGVGRLGGRFPNDGQPGSSSSRSFGMGVRQLRVFIDKLTCKHQMRGHDLGELLRQSAKLRAYRRMQGPRVNAFGNRRLVLPTCQTGSSAGGGPPASVHGLGALRVTARLRPPALSAFWCILAPP